MSRMQTVVLLLLVSLGMGLSWKSAYSQGSGSSRVSPPPVQMAPAPPPEEFHVKLWRFLVRQEAPYTKWPPLPGKAGLRKAGGPHGPFVRLYTYKIDANQPQEIPTGATLVLENYSEDKRARTSIDVMYRYAGYDPNAGDWYWAKYYETGALATTPPEQGSRLIAGRVQQCSDCHRQARNQDFVFSNDPVVEDKAPARVPGTDQPVTP